MFGKLKEKLKSWFSSSKKKIEEESEVVEAHVEKPEKKKKGKKTKKESSENISKADEIIEHAKSKELEEVPLEFVPGTQKFEPNLEKLHQKADKLIEKAKSERHNEIPLKINATGKKLEVDLEKIKVEGELLSKEIDKIKKEEKEFKEAVKEVEIPELKEASLEPKKSFFSKIKSAFIYKISENEFQEIFDDLEMLLLENNVALEVVEDLRGKLAEKLIGKEIKRNELEKEIKHELKRALQEIIIDPDNPLEIIKAAKKPFTILFFGINGAGKTTSIAKIAFFLKKSGHSIVLAAGDTFRAASIEQLEEHAKKLGVPLIKHAYGADPAAVGFDAIKYAKNHNIDVVLIDTAGRMHTKTNLIEEMKKIERVVKPDLKIFVAESIAGNDATEQAKTFNEAIEIDGSILSKADIDEKGGTILSVSHATKKPIFYLGTGQNYHDIQLFNKEKFIESLGL